MRFFFKKRIQESWFHICLHVMMCHHNCSLCSTKLLMSFRNGHSITTYGFEYQDITSVCPSKVSCITQVEGSLNNHTVTLCH